MTREEAIEAGKWKLEQRLMGHAPCGFAEMVIEVLDGLELLKFEKAPALHLEGKLAAAFPKATDGGPVIFPTTVQRALEAAGLELVEKK